MLVTFKSDASDNILMYAEHAKPILDLWQKESGRGVITVAELDSAITSLEHAMAESKAGHTTGIDNDSDSDVDEELQHAFTNVVALSVRAFPLLEMLRKAKKRGCVVAWGI